MPYRRPRSLTAHGHIPSHRYNEGESDERRGDGYMEAWQPILSRCPWMPVGTYPPASSEPWGCFLLLTPSLLLLFHLNRDGSHISR